MNNLVKLVSSKRLRGTFGYILTYGRGQRARQMKKFHPKQL